MTNWWLVAIGLGIIGLGLTGIRFAEAVASFYRGVYEATRRTKFMARAATPELVQVVAGLGCSIGVLSVILGLFFADKM